ncbi:WD-40 repeat protein, partial [Reticulomyxa filosa]
YGPVNFIQNYINDLIVVCPLQYQLNAKDIIDQQEEGTKQTTLNDKPIECDFKKELKYLDHHLEHECPLKLDDCIFKPFGCDVIMLRSEENNHLTSYRATHKKLVDKFVEKFQQKQPIPKEEEDLQLQNEKKEEPQIDKLQFESKEIDENFFSIDNRPGHSFSVVSSPNITNSLFPSFYGIKSVKQLRAFTINMGSILSVQFSPFDGGRTICTAENENVQLWDVQSAKQLQTFEGHTASVCCVQYSLFHYYFPSKLSSHERCNDDSIHPSIVICSASTDKTIRFWDVEAAKEIHCLNGHTRPVRNDKTIHLWDVSKYKPLHILTGHTEPVTCVQFSPSLQETSSHSFHSDGDHVKSQQMQSYESHVVGGSGHTICSASRDKTVRLWDVETAKLVSVFKGHEHLVLCIQFLPFRNTGSAPSSISTACSNLICSGSGDSTIRLWDVRTGKQTHIFKGHTGLVNCVQFSPFLNFDENRKSDRNRSRSMFGFLNPSTIKSSNSSGNGYVICSGSYDKTIRFWDTRTTKQLHVLNGHTKPVTCIQFAQLPANVISPASDIINTSNGIGPEPDATTNTSSQFNKFPLLLVWIIMFVFKFFKLNKK